MARRALLERYAPASVLIDQKGRVLYFHGTTRDYLEQPSGEPTRDLLTMARDGLATKLRAAMREASEGKQQRDGQCPRPGGRVEPFRRHNGHCRCLPPRRAAAICL